MLPNTGFLCQLLEFEQLGWDASRFEGWGWKRWFEHPLAETAHQLAAKLLDVCIPDNVPAGKDGDKDPAAASTSISHSVACLPEICQLSG